MASTKKPTLPPLEDRFVFPPSAAAPGDRAALRSTVYEVEEKVTGLERTLKLWRRTGGDLDSDLRELWRHEMRQISRLMAYSGAQDVIVDILEFVEDEEWFGVVLAKVGQPLNEKRRHVPAHHWLRTIAGARGRSLLWRNIRRIAQALSLVHGQGLVHGAIDQHAIMTNGGDQPDFQLGGFEWSVVMTSGGEGVVRASIGAAAAHRRPASYAFAEDWRRLGVVIAGCLGFTVADTGSLVAAPGRERSLVLTTGERRLLKHLLTPSRYDQVNGDAIVSAIDNLLPQLVGTDAARTGTLVLSIDHHAQMDRKIYAASKGAIAVDDIGRQRKWLQADLQANALVLAPRNFDPEKHGLRVVTQNMVYILGPSRPQGAAKWDHAVCRQMMPRSDEFRLGEDREHQLGQSVLVAKNASDAEREIARLGPGALDWSVFGGIAAPEAPDEAEQVRRALLVIQVVEAVVKALEALPIEVLTQRHEDGQPVITLRALPKNPRDDLAVKLRLPTTHQTLQRLFEEAGADAETKWRLSKAQSLGASRTSDVAVAFADLVDHSGARAYRFEADELLPENGRWFLRGQQEIGSEQAIVRRFRILRALPTRLDLAQMLLDPWMQRRSSGETLSEAEQASEAFKDLDEPKQRALRAIWETLPNFLVVGPPGVGKTKLATEVVNRRFATDSASRLLIAAQGHDALDHLQGEVAKAFAKSVKRDLLIVRSTTPERRVSTNVETEPLALDLLDRLAASPSMDRLQAALRGRTRELARDVRRQVEARVKNSIQMGSEERMALGAVTHLLLDGADVVVSTLNSADVAEMVETREQFDWVVIEEAAKATGPELLGAMMLSGRRLLIGDHRQLPAFDADRMITILEDHSLVSLALQEAEPLLSPLLRNGELDDVAALVRAGPSAIQAAAGAARRLLDPFRTFVEEDNRRAHDNPEHHRRISATLTEQRRMDPAIARIVSRAFYDRDLTTSRVREEAALSEAAPFVQLGSLPASPVVVVNFPHVSSPTRGESEAGEKARKAWHNPQEAEAVINVLRCLRAAPDKSPTLAVLAPYRAQVELLGERINRMRNHSLAHLADFRSVRSDGSLVGTVDSFQGNEADVVVLSLVRNNPRTGGRGLGFLQDRRRMNVALSRAKSQLIIVGSLEFLREAVRGVNPGGDRAHPLAFFSEMIAEIETLSDERRGKLALATVLDPSRLRPGS